MTEMEQTGVLVTAATIGSSVATFVATKGIDAWLRLRKARTDEHIRVQMAGMEERKYEDDRTVEGYQQTIADLRARLTHVESQLETQRLEHIDCLKSQATMAAEHNHALGKIADLAKEIDGLREWRHKVSNEEHAAVLKQHLQAGEGT